MKQFSNLLYLFVQKLKIYTSGILLIVMIFTTFGISKFVHYCGDEVSAESYFIKDSGTCGCPEEDEDGCCHEQAQYVQVLHEFTHTPTNFPSAHVISIFNQTNLKLLSLTTKISFNLSMTHVFAKEYSPPLHILNCSILI